MNSSKPHGHSVLACPVPTFLSSHGPVTVQAETLLGDRRAPWSSGAVLSVSQRITVISGGVRGLLEPHIVAESPSEHSSTLDASAVGKIAGRRPSTIATGFGTLDPAADNRMASGLVMLDLPLTLSHLSLTSAHALGQNVEKPQGRPLSATSGRGRVGLTTTQMLEWTDMSPK